MPDSRRDAPSDVGAALVDHVDVGGGAKIDHDARCAVQRGRRRGVGDAVGSHLRRVGRVDACNGRGLTAHDHQARAHVSGHALPFAHELRHHAGKRDGVDAAQVQAVFVEIAEQADVQFVFGERAVRGHAPCVYKLVAVKEAECGLGVAHIDGQKHGRLPLNVMRTLRKWGRQGVLSDSAHCILIACTCAPRRTNVFGFRGVS